MDMAYFAIVSFSKPHYSRTISPKSGFAVLLRAEIASLSEGKAMAWIVNGKEISDEEYEELLRQQAAARVQVQDLMKRLADSYSELTQFMRQNPGIVQPVHSNAEQMQQALYQKLRQNLNQADAGPRCCWIKEDGTPCRSPKMRTNDYCFAHMQMSEAKPKKFRLPAAEDANGIQMAIMEVQRALIDDEISEKKAGLLLYSLQIASANLERTTFGENPREMVTDYVEEETPDEKSFTAETRRRGGTPTTETRRHGEELKRSGDLVIGTSGDRNIGTSGQPGRILPHSETSTTETQRHGEKQVLPRMEREAAASAGA